MSLVTLKAVLLWCAVFNYSVLLLWVVLIVVAHDALYRINARFYRITPQAFDTINYTGIVVYKLFILFFNLVPYAALVLAM